MLYQIEVKIDPIDLFLSRYNEIYTCLLIGVNVYIVTMTISDKREWRPNSIDDGLPKYKAIAASIADDIAQGRLKPGDRMPTHRDLAWDLGVTVGTVSRAYAQAEQRGLIGGEVGRGTYVNATHGPMTEPPNAASSPDMGWHGPVVEFRSLDADVDAISQYPTKRVETGAIRLNHDFPPPGVETIEVSKILQKIAVSPVLADGLSYQPHAGMEHHRQAIAGWLKRRGLDANADRIVLTSGAHNGVLATLSALTRPGDRIATEEVCYPGIKAIAQMLGLELVPLPLDEDGIIPDAYRDICKHSSIKALYCVPTFQNPTTAVMPDARRREIAAIADEFGVAIVEDDVFGLLLEDGPPALASYSVENGYYVSSISKAIAPGLRIGFVHTPVGRSLRVSAAIRSSSWMASPLCAEITYELITSGAAERVMESHRRETLKRHDMFCKIFEGYDFKIQPLSLRAWLSVPEPWHTDEFVREAEQRGVTLPPTRAFTIGRARTPHAVRISLGPPRDRERLKEGLEILRDILEGSIPELALDVM